MPQSKTIRFDYTLLERLVDEETTTSKIAIPLGTKERAEIQRMANFLGVTKSKYLRLLHCCAINAYMTGQFEGFVDNHRDKISMKRFQKIIRGIHNGKEKKVSKEKSQEKS